MADRDIPDTWAETANAAAFSFYELERPEPDYRWAGGYGWGRGTAVALDILFLVDGREVAIRTIGERPLPTLQGVTRHAVTRLFSESLLEAGEELRLPRTWMLTSADRTIEVDGEQLEFIGIDLDGCWAGVASVPSRGVLVEVRAPTDMVIESIVTCTNWAMSDRPPVLS